MIILMKLMIIVIIKTTATVMLTTTTTTTTTMIMIMIGPDKIVAEKTKKIKKTKNNKANWMVSNSAKLDCRTKQHTQFGVSASNGSRDMARTKSWRKKRKKEKKRITKRIGW